MSDKHVVFLLPVCFQSDLNNRSWQWNPTVSPRKFLSFWLDFLFLCCSRCTLQSATLASHQEAANSFLFAYNSAYCFLWSKCLKRSLTAEAYGVLHKPQATRRQTTQSRVSVRGQEGASSTCATAFSCTWAKSLTPAVTMLELTRHCSAQIQLSRLRRAGKAGDTAFPVRLQSWYASIIPGSLATACTAGLGTHGIQPEQNVCAVCKQMSSSRCATQIHYGLQLHAGFFLTDMLFCKVEWNKTRSNLKIWALHFSSSSVR